MAKAGEQTKIPAGRNVWKGAEELRAHLVPIDSLEDHEQNPNKGDVFAISKSLEQFGQVRPILHQNGTIIAGHHVRAAAALLEWTHVAAVSHEFASDDEALAYLLVDNQVAKLSQIDAAKVYGLAMDLQSAGYEELPGFDIDAMETLQAEAGATPQTRPEDWEGGYSETEEQAAARAAMVAQYEPHREVVLMLSPEQHEEFGRCVRLLMSHYETKGTVETIVRAVTEAAVGLETGV